MALASLIIGIIAVLLGILPLCSYLSVIPAIVGLILGIVALKNCSKLQLPTGQAKAGIILNSISLFLLTIWAIIVVMFGATIMEKLEMIVEEAQAEVEKAEKEEKAKKAAPAPAPSPAPAV